MDGHETHDSAWQVVAAHDDAAALIDTLLELDPDAEFTKTELSDRAGVPLKSLYLNGTLDAVAELGLLEKCERDGEEPLYSVAADSEAMDAARAFGRLADAPVADSS
jgi:hypothetical protein